MRLIGFWKTKSKYTSSTQLRKANLDGNWSVRVEAQDQFGRQFDSLRLVIVGAFW